VLGALIEVSARETRLPDFDGFSPLHYAAHNRQEGALEMLLQAEEGQGPPDAQPFSALHCAVAGGSEQCLGLLLAHSPEGASAPDREGRSPLHLAAGLGLPSSAQLLLEAGAELEATDRSGRTPLLRAAAGGHAGMLALLQERGAASDSQDSAGNTALDLACAGGHAAAAGLLLRLPSASTELCNRQDGEGRSALHLAAARGMVEAVEGLLEAGASVTCVDKCGDPPALACAKDDDTATCLAMILALYLSTPACAARKSLRSMSSLGSLRRSEGAAGRLSLCLAELDMEDAVFPGGRRSNGSLHSSDSEYY
jgi:ankyrin repeat protein